MPFTLDKYFRLDKNRFRGKKGRYNSHMRGERTKKSQRSQRRLSHCPYFEPGNGWGVELLEEEVPTGE